MTIFGTPGGTPLNTTPFQGTQPGNAVQATLSPVNPGVGLFPPNSNNQSGDTVMASASRATLPLTALTSSYGQKNHPAAGRTVSGLSRRHGSERCGRQFPSERRQRAADHQWR